MATLTLDRLTKSYEGGEAAVSDLTFSVADGEFMVLLGPSGCGKSSALRMIAGLEPITSGTVSIDGAVVNQRPAKERDIAMVFQSYALYPHMNVYDNIAFGLRRRNLPRTEIERRVAAAADKLGLSALLKRRPSALSGGQRQRVALGRAIVRNPKVFLFDEPLSNLDAALRVSMRNELIRQQAELETTTIYVTHDQVEAMTMGHRICIMNRGRAVQIGTPLDVYRRPADTFVARFLGNPPMNLMATTLVAGNGGPFLRIGKAQVPLPREAALALPANATVPGALLIGVRPEDLYAPPPAEIRLRTAEVAARIVAVEPLGAETLILLALDGVVEEVIARIGRDTTLRAGDMASIAIDTAALHLFEAPSGRALFPVP
jgi:multiple sugar transport system ATP-binding protein